MAKVCKFISEIMHLTQGAHVSYIHNGLIPLLSLPFRYLTFLFRSLLFFQVGIHGT
jgi:hypothetical protein